MLLNCVLEKTLESTLDCKEIQSVHPKGNHSWVFIGKTDVKAETPIVWLPDAKNWLIWKDPDAEKDWGQEEKGTTEDEMIGWHYLLNGHGFGWTPGIGGGQGDLACMVHGVAKRRIWLSSWTELNWISVNSLKRKATLIYMLILESLFNTGSQNIFIVILELTLIICL